MTMENVENMSNVNNVNVGGEKAEKYDFEADIPQVMSLVINNVYSSKELFVRELVSNASDALSKMMTNKSTLDKEYETEATCNYKIQIILDEENKTITIRDNGIGMTHAELKAFLGSIASSGTKKFREALSSNAGSNVDSLIGRFGLGFYSAFLVADRVDVITKSVKDDAYLWSSDGTTSYTIEKYEGELFAKHGTSVILRLEAGEEVYLQASKITELVKKHSLLVRYPVSLITTEKVEKKDNEKDNDKEVAGETEVEEVVEEVKEEAEKTPLTRQVEKVISSDISIWTKKVEEIPEEDLKSFYKATFKDYDDYAAVQSWHFEGIIDLKILLFIPKRAKMSIFDQNTKNDNIKIYNNSVFVMDNLDNNIVPEWMSFVYGIVSSNNFPMNISREFLQGSSAMNLLKNKLPKCISEMINKMMNNSSLFDAFYNEFSSNIKLAIKSMTGPQQETWAKFLRYPTNKRENVSLEKYLENAPQDCKQILLLTGLSMDEVRNSIYLEAFKNEEVLLMHEAVDEVMLQGFKTFRDIPLQMISSEGCINNTVENEDYKSLVEFINTALKNKIERVELSNRFEAVPAILLTSKYAYSSTMENMLKSHPGAQKNPMFNMMMGSKKILEININNPIINKLKDIISTDNDKATKYINFIYNSALLSCGFSIENKTEFIKDVYGILGEALNNSINK